jgi:hypothetical protein
VSALTTAAALTRENAESTKAEATIFWNDFIMDVSVGLQKGRTKKRSRVDRGIAYSIVVVRPFICLSKALRRPLLAANTYSFAVNGRRINPNGSYANPWKVDCGNAKSVGGEESPQ